MMTTDYDALIDLVAAHRPHGIDCACGRPINSDRDWAHHLAQMLALTQEWGAAVGDVLALAREALASRWENPGPPYPEPVPTGVVQLGDWASEHLPDLIDEVERLPHVITASERTP